MRLFFARDLEGLRGGMRFVTVMKSRHLGCG
jgi:hypothetical protein